MKSISSVLPFVIITWCVGIGLFVTVDRRDQELKADLQAISDDRSTIHDYQVTKKYVQNGANDSDAYWVVLSGPTEESFSLSRDNWGRTRIGQIFESHHVNGRVVFPALQNRSPNAKWVISGFCFVLGALPLFFVAIGHFIGKVAVVVGAVTARHRAEFYSRTTR